MLSTALTTLSLLPLALAHFTLEWPEARGFSDDTSTTFPCGGFNTVSSNRTNFPTSGGPIQLDMEHTQTNLAVYLALGDNPGGNFNTILLPQLSQQGLGDFCMGMVNIPANLNVSAGTLATIQVVSNGDGGGGLYQCADVVFVDTPLSTTEYSDHCKNNTGSKVVQENISGNPNGTAASTTASATSSVSAAASAGAAAAQATAASWVLGVIGMAGLAML
ncbi:hypothetical protein P153DRAFT_365664 [Dothidotthia symphoricarpi CBS 119687]|uniref:Copper acquisition factor BIM1-like domain-containing protein n=1 Tax=Dothidotthia symphoricarpi CBS 119687 TaxID=1392245 RepID=A0A6A6AJK3_9PLEO|nr:uncharacterized protein P153DRAFT_365664 [Dothidotthia symphoricarpi CBS 119687]KAF2131057.1 hypothetical protein P153DRAFT_365664 [Dothidotthia symphoricarpi CBS 119687]